MPFIFDKKPEVGRKEFRGALGKRLKGGAPPPKLSFQDKMKIEKKLFGPSNVEKISLEHYQKALRKMDKLKFGALSEEARKSIVGTVGYLKRIIGTNRLKKPPQVKEEKKDTSAFGGARYLPRERVRQWFNRDAAWQISKIPIKIRKTLEKKIFPKKYGTLIDPREARIVSKILELPKKTEKEYGMRSREERIKTSKLLKKFIGK